MEKRFTIGTHLLIKAIQKAGLTFPITKGEAMKRAEGITVRVDFDKTAPLTALISSCRPDTFENVAAFYNALISAQTRAVAEEKGYY